MLYGQSRILRTRVFRRRWRLPDVLVPKRDVYKRQALSRFDGIRHSSPPGQLLLFLTFQCFSYKGCSVDFSIQIAPVSYTHLDVYKRQLVHRDGVGDLQLVQVFRRVEQAAVIHPHHHGAVAHVDGFHNADIEMCIRDRKEDGYRGVVLFKRNMKCLAHARSHFLQKIQRGICITVFKT